MADELKADGEVTPKASGKSTVRKTVKKVEDLKMEHSDNVQEAIKEAEKVTEETVADVKQAAKKTSKQVKKATEDVVADVKQAAEEVKAPANGHGTDSIRKMVKDASAQVERLPGTKQVKEAMKNVADQVGDNEITQKAVRRVRDAADQVKQGAQDLEKNPLVVAVHKVLLAGIGAAALAQEEIEDFVNRLVERGSIAEADGKRMIKDVLDQRRKQMEQVSERAQEVASDVASNLSEGSKRIADDMEERIEVVLAKMNIPTKEEIETLTSKITALTRKVDDLKKPE